jgi:hypothetical protein
MSPSPIQVVSGWRGDYLALRVTSGNPSDVRRRQASTFGGWTARPGWQPAGAHREGPRDFGRFNAAYREYFGAEPPARSTVRAELVLDGKLEVEAIAYKPA